jgi:hypothetical protein
VDFEKIKLFNTQVPNLKKELPYLKPSQEWSFLLQARDKLRRELQIAILPADWFQFLPRICIQKPTLDTKGRINTTYVCESSPPCKE